jgi:Meckel syndrome type 1 protein
LATPATAARPPAPRATLRTTEASQPAADAEPLREAAPAATEVTPPVLPLGLPAPPSPTVAITEPEPAPDAAPTPPAASANAAPAERQPAATLVPTQPPAQPPTRRAARDTAAANAETAPATPTFAPPAPPAPLAAPAAQSLAAPRAAPHASPARQVAPVALAVALGHGGTPSITLRLDPGELGQVEVRIERPADGPAQVKVQAERPETLALLQRDAPELSRALHQAGIQPDQCRLSFSLGGGQDRSDGHGGANPQQREGQGQRWAGGPMPNAPAATPLPMLSLLDIAV